MPYRPSKATTGRQAASQPTTGQPATGQPATGNRVSRRGLFLAGAGLVAGAGATEAANLLAGGSPADPARPPSPGEDLMTEHGVLKRLLLGYQAVADQLAAGHTPPAGAITDAAEIIADYIEGFHEGLEEAYVFPRVRDREPALVRTLLTQHDRGRHLTAAISTAASEDLGSAAVRRDLRRYLTLFIGMYAPHEAWEDTVIFPALRTAVPQRTLDELAERFADLQNAQYGDHALAQLLSRVTGVEQQLGIDDLNAVTPPLVYRS
ncbi:MAG TPA: hemerythrin domain-containing protein [Jatrophihabitans sp.]|nr:hemerythrin domain-containing protein [Jatrophihabitans sp.]